MQLIFSNGTERENAEAFDCCANFIAACTPGTNAGSG
jgi:hypothetical protein